MICLRYVSRLPSTLKANSVLSINLQNLQRMSSVAGSQRLAGKVAIVTASTEGIGYAIAEKLAADGAAVVVSSRKENSVNKVAQEFKSKGLNVIGTPCHVGKAEDRKRLIDFTLEKLGGIDILVSNAAVNPVMTQVLDTPEDAWDKIFDVNVKCAFLLTKEVAPHIEKRGGGSIVYVSSIAGYQPMPLLGAYSVSKTALLGLTRAVALQLASQNIRVNCIAPGIIKTKFSQALWSNESLENAALALVPAGRIGEPKDCAGLVSFLCSEDAAYITGENIPVAGGYFCKI